MDDDLDDPQWLSAAAFARAYASGEVSPVEIAEGMLSRIEALDARLNAFCLIDGGATLAQAEASQERWATGEPLSPLDGVPVAVKDLLVTKGWPTLRGSKTVDRNQAWAEDAPTVARLREAGAVFIGKTTTPEFGFKGSNDSPLTGTTRNPWDLSKTPGGSSGGSAAALAAGLAPLALGTDGGGSVRIPASFTGTFALKPSFGRVAAYPLSPFGTLAHVGPMTRTVEDAALLMNELTKPDPRDWHQVPNSGIDYVAALEGGVKGARIAYCPTLGWATGIDRDVHEAVNRAALAFQALGAQVDEIDPPLENPSEIFRTLWFGAAGQYLNPLPDEKKALLDPGLRQMVEEGLKYDLPAFFEATLARGRYGSAMRQWMENFDFILTPATAVPAFGVDRIAPGETDPYWLWMPWTPFSYPFNLTQQPAASINCGFTKDGLPIGLQIVGKMFDDAGVLRAARAFEAAHPEHQRHAPGW
ncbi:Acylamidase [Alphaproteobacteria bacterium SO-S41]|nr:Acylamidase [Alphaproteobacteria bacterium SO-S41]